MNWKFWTWPKQIRTLKSRLEELRSSRDHWCKVATRPTVPDEREVTLKLTLARRALARPGEGMSDEQMAEAFTNLIENKGFEAILQLITSEELAAMDRMTEDGASIAQMRKSAGAVDALTNLHHQLIHLEAQAKQLAQRKSKAA